LARISDEIIDRIQSANDIVEVVSSYFPLKRAGRSFKALCPFHREKTPSFIVSPDKQIYHCFGCGEGGNVFGFLMKLENIGFLDAVKMLAERARIELRFDGERGGEDKKAGLYRINDMVSRSYHKTLVASGRGKAALAYLSSRSVTGDTIKGFMLGYAPGGWDNLGKWARKKEIPGSQLRGLGLVIPGERGDYDRFRDRIIFPIRNVSGKVVGFSGRVMGDAEPKYVNSPDSSLFSKGRILYGLYLAKSEIVSAGYAIVCEGQIDCIMLHQAGFRNTVATQGTALTDSHARLLKRYCRDVVMAFDADEAGKKAALRGLDVLLEAGLRVRIAVFPPGLDPDGFVRKYGGEKVGELMDSAPSLLDFLLQTLLREYDVNTEQGRVEISSQMLSAIARLESAVLRDMYLKKLAGRLGASVSALAEDMARISLHGGRAPRPPAKREPAKAVLPVERYLVREMLACPETVSMVREMLTRDDFIDPACREVVAVALSSEAAIKPEQMISRTEDPEAKKLIAASIASPEGKKEDRKRIEDAIKKLKRMSIERKVGLLQKQLASPGITPEEVERIQKEINRQALAKSDLGMV